ncbi:hypothetical protein LBMAG27_16190 [Bacteroidota bacterium]|nr:hypothetical protein LBMAG27_16190 [Bacteroidota bacterium]
MEESNILDESLSKENGFKLDQGFCYFTPVGLDIRNNRFSFSTKHKASFRQWFIGIILPVILVVGNSWLAYKGFLHNRNISLYVTICCWVLYVFFIRIALRPPKIFIERNLISSIKHAHAIRFFSKGYFVIRYFQNGKEKKSILILPGVLNNDVTETEKAIRLLKENNYTVE